MTYHCYVWVLTRSVLTTLWKQGIHPQHPIHILRKWDRNNPGKLNQYQAWWYPGLLYHQGISIHYSAEYNSNVLFMRAFKKGYWFRSGCLLHVNSSHPSAAYMRERTGSPLVHVVACRLFGAKPLPEPLLAYCQPDSREQISVKFESEFHSRKCIWKRRLPKWWPFCPGIDELRAKHMAQM